MCMFQRGEPHEQDPPRCESTLTMQSRSSASLGILGKDILRLSSTTKNLLVFVPTPPALSTTGNSHTHQAVQVVLLPGVLGVVVAQRAHEDHGDEASEENDHHEGVEDGEPMDLRERGRGCREAGQVDTLSTLQGLE